MCNEKKSDKTFTTFILMIIVVMTTAIFTLQLKHMGLNYGGMKLAMFGFMLLATTFGLQMFSQMLNENYNIKRKK